MEGDRGLKPGKSSRLGAVSLFCKASRACKRPQGSRGRAALPVRTPVLAGSWATPLSLTWKWEAGKASESRS